MRVLIDECVPRRIRKYLTGHDAHTVPDMGWSGKKDKELLSLLVAGGFDVLLTVDRNIRHQHNLASLGASVIVLAATSNRLVDLIPLMPSVLTSLGSIQPGELVEING